MNLRPPVYETGALPGLSYVTLKMGAEGIEPVPSTLIRGFSELIKPSRTPVLTPYLMKRIGGRDMASRNVSPDMISPEGRRTPLFGSKGFDTGTTSLTMTFKLRGLDLNQRS